MASPELSRRVEKLLGYAPLSEMSDYQRREFNESLLAADSFEDLPGKWQAAILGAERNRPKLRLVSERLVLCQRGPVSQPHGTLSRLYSLRRARACSTWAIASAATGIGSGVSEVLRRKLQGPPRLGQRSLQVDAGVHRRRQRPRPHTSFVQVEQTKPAGALVVHLLDGLRQSPPLLGPDGQPGELGVR